MSIAQPQGQILKAFDSPVFDSQSTFRTVLRANSYPGTIQEVTTFIASPEGVDIATAAIALTLLDFETRVWLDPLVGKTDFESYLSFHCGCPIVDDHSRADFAIITDISNIPALSGFDAGSQELPDRSATLIIQVPELNLSDDGLLLSGPGIETTQSLVIAGVPHALWEQRQELAELFPRGIDLIFTSGTKVAALPRTTLIGN